MTPLSEEERKAIYDTLVDVIAWGATYGPVLSLKQWEQSRDSVCKNRFDTLMEKLGQPK